MDKVSDHLGLPPIATYASLCLWNFKQIMPSDDIWDLDNLTTINTFTGSIDESWFYLVSVYFEHKGALAITTGLDAIKCAYDNNTKGLVENLQQLAEAIDSLGSVLMKMEEMCDPHVFYFRIRPYLAGWKNMTEVGLKGVYYGEENCQKLCWWFQRSKFINSVLGHFTWCKALFNWGKAIAIQSQYWCWC